MLFLLIRIGTVIHSTMIVYGVQYNRYTTDSQNNNDNINNQNNNDKDIHTEEKINHTNEKVIHRDKNEEDKIALLRNDNSNNKSNLESASYILTQDELEYVFTGNVRNDKCTNSNKMVQSELEMDSLVREIWYLYHNSPSFLSKDISEIEVQNIVQSILIRKYQFSSLEVVRYNGCNPFIFRKFKLNSQGNNTFCMRPNPKDKIVLYAMTKILFNYYYESSNELRLFKEHLYSFYSKLEKLGQVQEVYQLDLSKSFQTIGKKILYSILEKNLNNQYILNMIHDFCQLEAKDYNGNSIEYSNKYFGIPPSGIFSELLLNIYLSILDTAFMQAYPDFPYLRYTHEVYVLVPANKSKEFDPDSEFLTFFLELYLDGNVSILSPGDKDIECYGGKIGINNSGYIVFTPKGQEKLFSFSHL